MREIGIIFGIERPKIPSIHDSGGYLYEQHGGLGFEKFALPAERNLYRSPIELFLHARVEIFNRFLVAEANLQTVVVSGEGVDRVSLDHVSAGGALELADVGEAFGDLHPFLRLEAVLENVCFAFEEREPLGPLLHFDLGALFVLVDNEPGGPPRRTLTPEKHGNVQYIQYSSILQVAAAKALRYIYRISSL